MPPQSFAARALLILSRNLLNAADVPIPMVLRGDGSQNLLDRPGVIVGIDHDHRPLRSTPPHIRQLFSPPLGALAVQFKPPRRQERQEEIK